ncbi:MAG: hypothetical protein OXH34_01015 [Bacteroidetes bacterium]|nr:hypothetical protein [Bacteroidota bacterium]
MVTGERPIGEKGSKDVSSWHTTYEIGRDQLRKLAKIHLTIDQRARKIERDEPDWVFRLRKICLHVSAIIDWAINDEGIEHIIATEIRAAFRQMEVVWEYVPAELLPDNTEDFEILDKESRGILSRFDHPTPQSLLLFSHHGGLRMGNNGLGYLWLSAQMMKLALAYGFALILLAQELGADEENIMAQVAEVFSPGNTSDFGMDGTSSPIK